DTCDISLNCLIFGQGEVSEKFIRKLEGWAARRVGQLAMLPDDHPYKAEAPLIEADDFPYFFRPDYDQWNQWKIDHQTNDDHLFVHRGEAAPDVPRGEGGYRRVFFDDFDKKYTVTNSKMDKPGGALWHGPGWNPAVGGDHAGNNPEMPTPTQRPDIYEWDKDRGYLKLHNAFDKDRGRWASAAVYTVSDGNYGRGFKGGYVFRARFKYDAIDDPATTGGELFWGLWGYSRNARYMHHEHRMEHDFIEPDAKSPTFANLCSHHMWEAHFGSYTPKQVGSRKMVGSRIEKERGWPIDLQPWDNQWRTLEIRVDPDYTYWCIDPTGNTDPMDRSGFIEIARWPTNQCMLEEWYFVLNTCIRRNTEAWVPATETQQLDGEGNRLWNDGEGGLTTTDMGDANRAMEPARYRAWFDWVEILQRDAVVYPETVPFPFSECPTLSRDGNVVTCDPKLTGIQNIDYYWHIDGYPETAVQGTTFTLSPEDTGRELACMVVAAGATNIPHAWTKPMQVS
uniref:hypothetical protein n=2 Tax=Croceicoccus TaxID=1295327 RepID=UPI001EFADBD7